MAAPITLSFGGVRPVVAPLPVVNPPPVMLAPTTRIIMPPPRMLLPPSPRGVVPQINLPIPAFVPAPIPIISPRLTIVKELTLRSYQMPWATRAKSILDTGHGYIDTSRMGSGKTYVALWLAKQFNISLLVICPVTMIDVWVQTAREYGVKIVTAISYESLRSQKNHQPKHGLLQRFDSVTEGGVHHVEFVPTEEYVRLCEFGILVVFDEVQRVKNQSAQWKASCAMIRPILDAGTSRWALLSGTPFDKEEHATNLLRLINYVRAHRMYSIDNRTGMFVPEGIQELIDACNFINPAITNTVLSLLPPAKETMKELAYQLYVKVIKAHISGAMPTPDTISAENDVKDGYYLIDKTSELALRQGLGALARATGYDPNKQTVDMKADNIGAVQKALVLIENTKAPDMARVARNILTAIPRSKVIIAINFTTTLDLLKPLLVDYTPLILNGEIKPELRAKTVVAFKENPAVRLLIMNIAVGGVGISLHDTVGDSPRFMLMSPGYKMLDVVQAAGRIYRDGTKSQATVRMFYGQGQNMQETGILAAMAKKTQVLRGTLESDVSQDLILPGDYPKYIEAVPAPIAKAK